MTKLLQKKELDNLNDCIHSYIECMEYYSKEMHKLKGAKGICAYYLERYKSNWEGVSKILPNVTNSGLLPICLISRVIINDFLYMYYVLKISLDNNQIDESKFIDEWNKINSDFIKALNNLLNMQVEAGFMTHTEKTITLKNYQSNNTNIFDVDVSGKIKYKVDKFIFTEKVLNKIKDNEIKEAIICYKIFSQFIHPSGYTKIIQDNFPTELFIRFANTFQYTLVQTDQILNLIGIADMEPIQKVRLKTNEHFPF